MKLRSSLGVRPGADGDNIIGGRTGSDVLNAVLFIQMNEAKPSGAQTMGGAVDRKFDGSFTNKPRLRMEMAMRRMRNPFGGKVV